MIKLVDLLKEGKEEKYPSCRPTPSQCSKPGKGKKPIVTGKQIGRAHV